MNPAGFLPGWSPPLAAATEPAAALALADALLLLGLLVLGLGVLQLARIARALETAPPPRSLPPAPAGTPGLPVPASADPAPELLAAVVAAVQVAGEPGPPSAARIASPNPR
jgi:hypothetical protein